MPDAEKPTTETPVIDPPATFETSHSGVFHGAATEYRCVAGELHLPDAAG